MGQRLYEHSKYQYHPANVNARHTAEKAAATFNQQVALRLTTIFQAMPTFWAIVAWIVLWMLANITIAHFDPLPWPLLLCLCSLPQLPLMVVILVGQGIISRHQELEAEEAYQTTLRIFHDSEQLVNHLHVQDDILVQLRQTLLLVLDHLGIEAEETTDHLLPVVKVQGHKTVIDEDDLRVTLIRSGYPAEMVGAWELPTLLMMEKQRPRKQEVVKVVEE